MIRINESFTAKGFTPADQVPGRTIEHIDIHHWGERGQTHDGVVAFFCTTGPGQTSAHYVVSAGRIDCIVSDADVAWHSGVWSENMRSIGIECRPEASDEDYAAVAELVRVLRARYGDLPLHPHREFFPTACPGVWDLDRLDRLARAGTIQTQSTPKGDTLSAAEVKQIIDYQKALAYGGWTDSKGNKHPGFMLVIEENQRRITALRSVVDQLAAKQGVDIDYAKIEQAVQAGTAKAIEDADLLTTGDVVSVDVNVTGK